MRVARYLRVSRSEQSTQMQRQETEDFCRRRGFDVVDTFEDVGQSGAKAVRPALKEMLQLVRKKQFDAVVVYKADRLFRSLHHMVTVLADFDALGVSFISATEPFDTSTPSGRLLLHVIAAMAEFERGLIVERTRDGMAAAKKKGTRSGKAIGRPKAKFNKEWALRLANDGWPTPEIARTVGTSPTTCDRFLRQYPHLRDRSLSASERLSAGALAISALPKQ